uniref:Uncharacterized protein n=1 Tax=Los Azufres archaeal virus 2 TaxID=1425359 RepID=A0A0A0P747_9VIRU|nr:hypothetical protein [Los Azufres archaeal virus 2]
MASSLSFSVSSGSCCLGWFHTKGTITNLDKNAISGLNLNSFVAMITVILLGMLIIAPCLCSTLNSLLLANNFNSFSFLPLYSSIRSATLPTSRLFSNLSPSTSDSS